MTRLDFEALIAKAKEQGHIQYSLLFRALRTEKEVDGDDIKDLIEFLEDLGVIILGKPSDS